MGTESQKVEPGQLGEVEENKPDMERRPPSVKPPGEFSFEPADWEKWRKRFERFMTLSGNEAGSDSDKINCILYCMGERAEDVVKRFPATQSYQEVLKGLDEIFAPKRNIVYERYRFNTRKQSEDESIDTFITDLFKLTETCDYGSLKEELIRDRIIVGMRDKTTSERLLLRQNLSLNEVIQASKQAELQAEDNKTLYEKDINRMKYKEHIGKKQDNCWFCGYERHPREKCPAVRAKCKSCGRIGHFAKLCRSKSMKRLEEEVNREVEEEVLFKLSASLLVLLHLSMNVVDEGHAVNPSCSCIRFTSTLGKERGTFSSPDYPRAYPPRLDCLLYTFLAAPHEIVELVFTDFDIYKEHLDCVRGDYLKVYWEVQGPGPPGAVSERSAWARAMCGGRADAPPALYSPGTALVLEFHTGSRQNNATGFIGTFSFIDKRLFETDGVHLPGTECDYHFGRSGSRPTHGRLYSPRYPSIYPNNVRCSYHFNGRPKERVKVVFEEVSLQKGDISCLRRADIIKIFDGKDTNAPAIAMLCNELTGYEVLSTGPSLLLQFTANSVTPGQGFAATFHFQPPPDSTAADSDRLLKLSFGKVFESLGPEVSATTSSCHQEFNSDGTKHGTFTSPHYPSPYPPNTHCHYEFFGRGKERVRLIFQDFYLHKSADGALECSNVDSLQAFVSVDGRLEKVDTFCGTDLPTPIMSNGPKLMLEFRGTHSSRYSRGFKISYSFVENFGISTGRQLKEFPCAFVYNSSESRNGTFASPNSPGPYPRDTECTYFFHGGDTEKVHLHFTNFDVEGVLPCEAVSASDYVEFSNQMTEDNRYGRYCGQMKDFHVESEKNFFKVTFRSNDRLDGAGFKAIYQFLEITDEYRAPIYDTASDSARVLGHLLLLVAAAITHLRHHIYH